MERAREFNRRHLLQLLGRPAIEFCDNIYAEPSTEDVAFLESYTKKSKNLESLLQEGINASTTDAPEQSISTSNHTVAVCVRVCSGCTLDEDESTFWSSSGTRQAERLKVEEHLTYRLKSPLCVVHSVQIKVFRAQFQWGYWICCIHPSKCEIFLGNQFIHQWVPQCVLEILQKDSNSAMIHLCNSKVVC